jgi:hypothetical protein
MSVRLMKTVSGSPDDRRFVANEGTLFLSYPECRPVCFDYSVAGSQVEATAQVFYMIGGLRHLFRVRRVCPLENVVWLTWERVHD